MASRRHLSRAETSAAIVQCVVLGAGSFVTYWLVVDVLSGVHSISRDGSLVGGLRAFVPCLV
jgi:hypothetical protein